MKKFILMFLWLLSSTNLYSEEIIFNDISSNIDDRNIKSIAISRIDKKIIYANSDNYIYKTTDGGEYWKKIFILKGPDRKINLITLHPRNPDILFAGTNDGLYISSDGGQHWNKTFSALNINKKDVKSIWIDSDDNIIIGTSFGVYTSNGFTLNWKEVKNEFSRSKVNYIIEVEDTYYLASTKGIYESNDLKRWKLTLGVLGATYKDDTSRKRQLVDERNEEILNREPNCLYGNGDYIFVGTNSGLYYKGYREKIWKKLPSYGLMDERIKSILHIDKEIFAGTDDGLYVYRFNRNKWTELFKGLTTKKINFLVTNQRKELILVGTSKGIYKSILFDKKTNPSFYSDNQLHKILSRYRQEPTINEVMKVATVYAEVHPEKIRYWRKAAKKKALLPVLRLGVDYDIKNTYEIYTSSSKSYWIWGPDSKTTNWEATLTWDLGELIWNSDQTNIDVRSRLSVQLRDDILDEVRRLYFERRRVQIGLTLKPPKTLSEKIDRLLRLEELTAGIDALTGGWFSEKIKQNNKDKRLD